MSVELLEEYIAAADLNGLNDLLTRDPALAKSQPHSMFRRLCWPVIIKNRR